MEEENVNDIDSKTQTGLRINLQEKKSERKKVK